MRGGYSLQKDTLIIHRDLNELDIFLKDFLRKFLFDSTSNQLGF